MIAIQGTPATTPEVAHNGDDTITLNLPAGIQAGEMILIAYISQSKVLSYSSGGRVGFDLGTEGVGFVWWEATGTEGSTVDLTIDVGGSVTAGSVAVRLTGVDVTALTSFQNIVTGTTPSAATFDVDANTLTGVSTDSWIMCLWGEGASSRGIDTLDADQTLVGSQTANNHTCHLVYETGVTANSAYSTTMTGTRDFAYALLEIPAAAAGDTTAPRSITISTVGQNNIEIGPIVPGSPSVTIS